MHFEQEVLIEFDVLDAAINECLPGYAPAGWVEFRRREVTPASTLYDLYLEREGNLGDLGQLSVRKVGPRKTLLYFMEPKRPISRHPSQEEWLAQNFPQYPSEDRIRKKVEFLSKFQDEADELHRRRLDHQTRIIRALFSRLADDSATTEAFSGREAPEPTAPDPVEEARRQVQDFRALVERQLCKDLTEDGPPQEKHIRGLLQAFLTSRSYREVLVRAGRSDILVHLPEGRLVFETKIWRGESSYQEGLGELSEYILGENSDGRLLGAFFVLCDPTDAHRAVTHLGLDHKVVPVDSFNVDVYVVNLAPETPSSKRALPNNSLEPTLPAAEKGNSDAH